MALGARFYSVSPFSGEGSGYSRNPRLFYFTGARPFTWIWKIGLWPDTGPFPPIRMLVDGAPVTDFVLPDAESEYNFVFDVPNGNHIVDFEGVPAGVVILRRGFVVNTSGAKLASHAPYVVPGSWELNYNNMGMGYKQVPYSGQLPVPNSYLWKVRAANPYTTRLPKDQRWVQSVDMGYSHARRFVSLAPHLDVDILNDQKWFAPFISRNTRGVPRMTMRDGHTGKGCLGILQHTRMAPDDTGVYWIDQHGRLGHYRWLDGEVRTIAGWRLKEGVLEVHR